MARRKRAKHSNTSITDADAYSFIEKTELRTMLSCGFLPGFHLLKLAKGGSWRYRYSDVTGRRRTVTIGSFPAMLSSEAAEKAYQWINDESSDPLKDRENRRKTALSEEEAKKRKTLKHYLEGKYSKIMETWPPLSAKMNKNRILTHFVNLLDVPMDEITGEHVAQWQEQQTKRHLAHSTIKRTYVALKAILRQAVADNLIDADPLQGFRLDDPSFIEQQAIKKRGEILSKKRRMLTSEEVIALHRGLDGFAESIRQQRRNSRSHGKSHLADLDLVLHPHWFIPFCHLGLHTGLRPGDIYSLTWQELNINFAKLKKITGKSARSIRKGKGGTLVEMRLNPRIHSIMKEWWQQNGTPETGLVFPSPVTGGQLVKTAHYKPWTAVKEFGGIPKDLNFYALRHHFISSLVTQGMPLLAVAALAGHKSTAMIELHYGHLCEKQGAQAVDVLAQEIEKILGEDETKRNSKKA